MSHPSDANVGDTISEGIQDVAALLPLLGTDQCERHVGAALESGYIYAAATPLSIFGSLGIVKAAFATYLASVTNGFHGGKWFHNAGFGTAGSGSVIPLVTIVIGTKQYGAERKLEELLKEQHLDDPELISDVKFFGWEKKTLDKGKKTPDEGKKTLDRDSFLSSKFSFSWTFALVLASALFSTISFIPYLYLTHNQWDQPISWLFPALRSIGSMLCVISVQCALQLRIHRIVISSLLLMKSQKHHPRSSEEASNDRQTLMEVRLRKLRGMLAKKTSDKEHGAFGDETERAQLKSEVDKALRLDITLLIHQVILLAGMVMIVAGYVGCFNLVHRSDAKYGPYIWLGMETFLSILRMALWGWNPSWAQGDTGLEMKLQLKSTSRHESTRSKEPPPVIFPPITTSRSLSQLLMKPTSLGGRVEANAPQPTNSFIVISAEDFLAAATPYVGPLSRLQLGGISLYHAIVPEEVDGTAKRKLLCLTARPDDSEGASISLFIRDNNPANTEPYKIFSSQSCRMFGSQTRSLQITLEDEISPPVPGKSALISPENFYLLFQYSSILFRRLFVPPPVSSIRPLWTLTLPSPPTPEGEDGDFGELTEFDEKYIGFRKAEDTMRAVEYDIPDVMRGKHPQLAEHAILFMVAILEIRLCINDHIFEESTGLSPAVFRPLAGEWKRRMKARVTSEKKQRLRKRSQDDEATDTEQIWHSLIRELRLLRQLPADSPILQKWKHHISAMDADEILPVLELFKLAPFTGLQHLTSELLNVFTDNDAIADSEDSMQSHHEITISATQTPHGSQLVTLGSRGDSQSSVHMRFTSTRTELPREPSQKTLVESEPSEDQVISTPEQVSPAKGEQRSDVHLAAQTSALAQNKSMNLKGNVESNDYFHNHVDVVN
ncbi:hypothetical protein V5O48_007180 [Marasmius crinis-equi]|uniref:Uncharacterized protein n=1 Tax=Marasmius crinis-equi TaxID=585013 RepID=A0ABR3FHH0_9AGAR